MIEVLLIVGIVVLLLSSVSTSSYRWTASPRVTKAVDKWHRLANGDPVTVQKAIQRAALEAESQNLSGVPVSLIEQHIIEIVEEKKNDQ